MGVAAADDDDYDETGFVCCCAFEVVTRCIAEMFAPTSEVSPDSGCFRPIVLDHLVRILVAFWWRSFGSTVMWLFLRA